MPVYPRWYAYLNFFSEVMGVFPAGLVVLFKEGPLAWNGIIVWGIGVAIFFIWICVTAYLVIAWPGGHATQPGRRSATGLEPLIDVEGQHCE